MNIKHPMRKIEFLKPYMLKGSKAQSWRMLAGKAFFWVLFILPQPASAQREFGVCDSTIYTLNADTMVVAGRNRLYVYHNQQLAPLYDFATANPDEFIRDVDLVKPDLWFVVVGLRYIGGPTKLYRSINRGLSWQLDTAHFQASNAGLLPRAFFESINNLQHLQGDTLLMFVGYYQSGVIFSTDLGVTWKKWFDNLIAFYQGMFYCQGRYYIFGYEGDAFRASMFGFDRSALFSSDSTGLWNSFNNAGYHPPCYNGTDTVRCIFAPHTVGRCGSYQFFKARIDQMCGLVSVASQDRSAVKVYPNPFNDYVQVTGLEEGVLLELYDLHGRFLWRGSEWTEGTVGFLSTGAYVLSVYQGGSTRFFRLIKASARSH